jgi:hypothetical protein
MITERAPSISQATDLQLMKAHHIMRGVDPNIVLDPRTSPKTNAFAHNIHDPSDWSHVTIDGRQADIIEDNMRGWTTSRPGLGVRTDMSGGYSDREHIMRSATRALTEGSHMSDSRLRDASPADVQAVTWVEGKRIERSIPMASGKPASSRKQGPTRAGQSYQKSQKLYG